jgi:UDP-N-acetylmuramate--alanine ligase
MSAGCSIAASRAAPSNAAETSENGSIPSRVGTPPNCWITSCGVGSFGGVRRRFTKVGAVDVGGASVSIIDDYAHHPVEIKAVLSAAREAVGGEAGRVIAVAQPHRYSRLGNLMDEFQGAFNDADAVYVTPVYAAGEPPIEGINRDSYAEALRAHGHRNVITIDGEDDLAAAVAPYVKPGAAIIGTGAGSITGWMYNLPKKLEGLT